MDALTVVVNIIYLLVCVVIIAIVLFQTGRSAGMGGAISGGAETFFGKNKGRAYDEMLKKYTGWVALFFVVISVALVLMLK
ncbi:MAG: preprotein translocase subunit SecG [Clostridiaceae bacterium]|mgnify:CR=1 FL=1|nr:preprotein translocase subunit SecG [Clostridiaceae bacterium]